MNDTILSMSCVHLEACDRSSLVDDCSQAMGGLRARDLPMKIGCGMDNVDPIPEKFVLELWSVRTRRGAGNRTHL